MKNFQQTPKQRRAAKAAFAQQKHLVRTSRPLKVFEQQYCYNYYGSGKRNLVHHVDGRR